MIDKTSRKTYVKQHEETFSGRKDPFPPNYKMNGSLIMALVLPPEDRRWKGISS